MCVSVCVVHIYEKPVDLSKVTILILHPDIQMDRLKYVVVLGAMPRQYRLINMIFGKNC